MRSDAIKVYVFGVPSMLKPSMFRVFCDKEKAVCVGRPTATDKLLDDVVTAELTNVALMRTGVGMVPEFTSTVTNPLESLVFVTVVDTPSSVSPPVYVVAIIETLCPGSALLATSTTLKVTCDVATNPDPFK